MPRPRGRRRPLGLCITAPSSARGAATSAEHVVPATVALATAESPCAWTWLQRAPTLLLTQEAVPGLWSARSPICPRLSTGHPNAPTIHTLPGRRHAGDAACVGATVLCAKRSAREKRWNKRCHETGHPRVGGLRRVPTAAHTPGLTRNVATTSVRAQTTGCFEITQGSVLALVGCPRVFREDPKARATREKSRGWTPRAMVCPSKDRTQKTQRAHGMLENTCESQRT